ncbi:hypothetical protein D3C74_298910 [compost metagenome]
MAGSLPSPKVTVVETSPAAISSGVTPTSVASDALTSVPVVVATSWPAVSVSSAPVEALGSASSSSSASASAPSPEVAVIATRYCEYAAGSASVNGRVWTAQRNCWSVRSSSVVQVWPSFEPSTFQALGAAVPVAPEVRV